MGQPQSLPKYNKGDIVRIRQSHNEEKKSMLIGIVINRERQYPQKNEETNKTTDLCECIGTSKLVGSKKVGDKCGPHPYWKNNSVGNGFEWCFVDEKCHEATKWWKDSNLYTAECPVAGDKTTIKNPRYTLKEISIPRQASVKKSTHYSSEKAPGYRKQDDLLYKIIILDSESYNTKRNLYILLISLSTILTAIILYMTISYGSKIKNEKKSFSSLSILLITLIIFLAYYSDSYKMKFNSFYNSPPYISWWIEKVKYIKQQDIDL